MFGHKTHGPAGNKDVTRREFLSTGLTFLGAIPLLGFFGGLLLRPTRSSWLKTLNSSDGVVTVYKMVPLPGIKYDKAEICHMANKIFPSIAAAHAHRPHRGFLYGLKAVPLPRSLVNDTNGNVLFCGRKDFDQRVRTDQHLWRHLGVDVAAVFSIVKNA